MANDFKFVLNGSPFLTMPASSDFSSWIDGGVFLSQVNAYSETGSGGVVCNSSAPMTRTLVHEVGSESVVCGGSAQTSIENWMESTGVLADGEAINGISYTQQITAAGVVCNGSASVTSNYGPTPTGGVICAGVAFVGLNHTEDIPAAGVVCSGFAPPAIAIPIDPAGVVCAGDVPQGIGQFVSPAGVVCAGDVPTTVSIFITPAGVRCNGSATIGIEPYIEPFGVIVSGQILTSITQYVDPAGVIADGEATELLTYAPTVVAAGAYLGGEASTEFKYNVMPTGGGILSGTPFVQKITTFTITGGAVIDGEALTLRAFIYFTDGIGLLVAGNALEERLFWPDISGGVYCRGDADRSADIKGWLHFRFSIGDTVYVPLQSRYDYIRQKVLNRYNAGNAQFYYVGIGWFPNAVMLSREEYLEWFCAKSKGEVDILSPEAFAIAENTCGPIAD